jgi:hypothetical protein
MAYAIPAAEGLASVNSDAAAAPDTPGKDNASNTTSATTKRTVPRRARPRRRAERAKEKVKVTIRRLPESVEG